MVERMSKGVFTLRDLYEQFQNVMKMGPLGQVMQMIPGMSGLMGEGMEKQGAERLKRFMTVMDSMTNTELDNPKLFTTGTPDKRASRVAVGSGCQPAHVFELLEEHKRFAKMVEKVGKSGLMKGAMNGDMGAMNQMMRNPKQMMQKLQQTMDPKMLSKLGGAGNMMEMMKQMSSNEGAMGDMMRNMQQAQKQMKASKKK
jgi:signal recognition particle subunit SRP54